MKKTVALIVSLLFLVGITQVAGAGTSKHRVARFGASRGAGPKATPGEILVKYKAGTALSQATRLEKVAGAGKAARLTGAAGVRLVRSRSQAEAAQVIDKLKRDPRVEYAEPNYIVKALYRPNDTFFGFQWALENTGNALDFYGDYGYGKTDADIDATDVWNFERGFTAPVTVAVLDTGIDTGHPDLASRLWLNSAESGGGTGVDDDANGYVDDVNGISTVRLGQMTANDIQYLGSGAPDPHYSDLAQSLSVDATTTIGTVQLAMFRYGNPSAGVRVSLRSDIAGPDIAYYDVAASEITSTPDAFFGMNFEKVTFVEKQFAAPVQLVPGQQYYLVVHSGADDYANSYAVYVANRNYNAKVDPFPAGMLYRNDTTWTADQRYDMYFATDGDDPDVGDEFGHGTHVSGIIGAAANNSKGISGVSFGARIMPVKVLDANGMGTVAGLARGIRYAADNGARVVNMSLGFPEYSETLQDAIDYAYGKGTVVVAAAGNEGGYDAPTTPSPLSYPAANNHVIGVGSTDPEDFTSYFSSHNASVDISAPGELIYSTLPTYQVSLNDYGYLTEYDALDGTSMAAPHVAGVAALMLSANSGLTPAQVETYLRRGSEDMGTPGRDDFYGAGRLNAAAAVAKAKPDVVAPLAGQALVNGGVGFVNRRDIRLATPATDIGSAVAVLRVTNSGQPWGDWLPYVRSLKWTLPARDGLKAVALRYRDWAGNASGIKYIRVTLDTVKPVVKMWSPGLSRGTKFTISWSGADDRSGMSDYDVLVRGGAGSEWRVWKKGTKSHRATFTARSGRSYQFMVIGRDRAGNASRSPISSTRVP